MGSAGGSAVIAERNALQKIFLKSVYSTLFLGNWKLRNFLRLVRIVATVDALWICIFRRRQARERRRLVYLHIFCVRLLQLLVQLTVQCEGLQLWNEQQVRLSRFFVCINI